jgi:hypothetical protein
MSTSDFGTAVTCTVTMKMAHCANVGARRGITICRSKARSISRSEPFGDDGDGQDGLESDGELVVSGGDATVAFEAGDAVLDGVS